MLCETNTPAFQILDIADIGTEQVTLNDVKVFSRIDTSYASNNTNLEVMISSAREKLEGLLNLYFYERTVKVQFYGNACLLPYGPTGDITEIVKNNETDPLDPDKYNIHGLVTKTITIGDGCGCYGNVTSWFYPIWGGWPLPWTWTEGERDFYTVTYNTGYNTTTNPLPKALKHAWLMLIDYFIKEQGITELEIPPAIVKLANRYSQNLTIQ